MYTMKDDEIKNNIHDEKEPEIDTDPGDDVVFEDNTEVTGADYAHKVKQLKERIKELEKKNTELLDGWQRERAEIINLKKRDEEGKKEFMKFAKEDIIGELLTVLDSFESAFKNKEAWEKADKNWRMGIEYIHSQLLSVLNQNGLTIINPLGEQFDHNRDEAIENVVVEDESKDGKIVEVVQVGYNLHDKQIRAPKVKVGEYKK
ncbi:MAG: molecular chaperone GrpE [Patescibacteria group bacterium]|jgi:molecular chaperone GrpE|nr:molecular chaperone GrpE [Patescibacteria group bacterium]